jgi:hypothetical protein
MKNFALINEDNLVVNVSIGNDDWDSTGWIEVKPENPIGIGFTYNEQEDIFIAPQPFSSWTRNGSIWEAPTPMPTESGLWMWVEADLNWQLYPTE